MEAEEEEEERRGSLKASDKVNYIFSQTEIILQSWTSAHTYSSENKKKWALDSIKCLRSLIRQISINAF